MPRRHSFEQAVLDAVDLGYEVTFRPPDDADAVWVDLVYRGKELISKASGAVSKIEIRGSRDPALMTYVLRRLVRSQKPYLTTKDGL